MPTLTDLLTCPQCNGEVVLMLPANGKPPYFYCKRRPDCQGLISCPELNALTTKPEENKPTFEQLEEAKRAATQQKFDLQMAAETQRFRRDAALRLTEKLLERPESMKYMWDRYMEKRSASRMAVELADDLVKELERAKQ